MKKLILWFGTWSKNKKSLAKSLSALFVFYGGAVLQDEALGLLKVDNISKFVLQFLLVAILVGAYTVLISYIANILDEELNRELERRRQISYAVSQVNNLISEQIAFIHKAIVDNRVSTFDSLSCIECIRNIVKSAYQYFESFHGQSERMDARIDFEVTFMTKSYGDDAITIPAYANRHGRAPFSLKERATTKDLYKNTVTAAIYSETKPNIKIIPNTAEPEERYAELYAGQKERIRSSIVYPVLNSSNELLGTLVVHCNRANFFLRKDESFWRELLEIYAVRLALEKSKIDLLKELPNRGQLAWNPPF